MPHAYTSADADALRKDINRAGGRLRAALLHGWDQERIDALRADLDALMVRKAILDALGGRTLTKAAVRDLSALLREQVAA